MAAVTSQLVISLLDRVTAPARAIAGSLKGIGQAITAANAGGLQRMAAANEAAMARLRTGMLESVAVGYALKEALAAPIGAATKFETAMLDIAQKSDLSDTAMQQLGDRIRKLAPQVNKTAQEVAAGVDVLTGMGLDPERAMAISPAIGKAATAYRADMSEVATMTYAAIDNLKVPAADATKLLDGLSYAAKSGAFEFRDMARYFPSLAADARSMGETGLIGANRLAAALEVVRKGAGTSEEAARNLGNVYQKAMSPETTKKFAKFGINIRKEMDKTRAEGGDMMETLADATMRALTKSAGGDVSKALSRMGDIFEDAQAQKGMKSFIENWAEYRRIRDESLKASGTVEEDYKRRMKTMAARVDALKVSIHDLGITVGEILLPPLEDVIKLVKPLVEDLRDFAKANPGVVGGAIKMATALIGMSIATRGAAWGFRFIKGGLLMVAQPAAKAAVALGGFAKASAKGLGASMLAGLARLRAGLLSLAVLGATAGPGAAFKALGGTLLGLLNPLRFLLPLVKIIGVIFSPMGALIAAVAAAIGAAGLFIWNNWDGIKTMFMAFGLAFSKAMEPAQPLLDKVGGALGKVGAALQWAWGKINAFLGPISLDTWARWGAAAGEAVGNVARFVLELPGRISKLGTDLYVGGIEWLGRLYDGAVVGIVKVKDFFASIPRMLFELGGESGSKLYARGVAWMDDLWDGLKARVGQITTWISGVADKIAGVFTGLGGKIRAAFGLDAAPDAANDNSPRIRKKATVRSIRNPDTPEADRAALEAAGGLALPIAPDVDSSGLAAFNRELDQTKAKIQQINQMKIGITAGIIGGGPLSSAASVAWSTRGENSDFSR